MRRHIPGLHSGQQDLVSNLDGLFLVRVEQASYRWHPQKPFFALRFSILEPTSHEALSFSGSIPRAHPAAARGPARPTHWPVGGVARCGRNGQLATVTIEHACLDTLGSDVQADE